MKLMAFAMVDRRTVLALSLFVLAARHAHAQTWPAQTWPAQPITIVVPFAAGGPTDLVARVLAEKLTPRFGQAVIVENRVGAGGDIGGQAVARATPDGYTFLLSTTGSLTVNRHLKPSANYDPVRDFKPVSLTFKSDHVVIARKTLPVHTLEELVVLLKKEPASFNYGSAGLGTTSHMIAELFKAKAGVDMRHVAYRGAGPALNDLVAGHIDVMVDSLANSLPQIQAGTVTALAVTGVTRHPALPHVPTTQETGIADFSAFAWGALLAPLNTPDAIIERLSKDVREIYQDKAAADRLAAAGAAPASSTPKELAEFMKADTEQWGRIVRDVGIKLQ
jgi:tripartite-type tricarboxylate transporter receptor subunit TctC